MARRRTPHIPKKNLEKMLLELESGKRKLHTATCCELARIATNSGFFVTQEYHSPRCSNSKESRSKARKEVR
jgi:hypothetical protein